MCMHVTMFNNDCFLQLCEKESESFPILNSTVVTLRGNYMTEKNVLLAIFVYMRSFVSNKTKKNQNVEILSSKLHSRLCACVISCVGFLWLGG